jgi:hypothetical protein
MTVETDDAVALRHDDVQIVRDEEHAEAALGAQPADQRIKLGLARIVDAAHGLVEYQDAGRADERARQHGPLQLAAESSESCRSPSLPAPTSASTRYDLLGSARRPSSTKRATVSGMARSTSKRCGT